MSVISGTYYKIDKNSANFSGVFVYLFKKYFFENIHVF